MSSTSLTQQNHQNFLEVLPGYSTLLPTGTVSTVTVSFCKAICPPLRGLSLLEYLRAFTTGQLSVVATSSLCKSIISMSARW